MSTIRPPPPSDVPDSIRVEYHIMLGMMARELNCQPEDLPLEVQVVARSALETVYNRGVVAGASEVRTPRRPTLPQMPAIAPEVEERPSQRPTEPPPAPARTSAGVYLHVRKKDDDK